jgi:bifunctional DNA-binding transcriptional regulator/antitoxin component of YhaV-PrlF toxin-antitoxin module
MALVRMDDAQIALPPDLRKELGLEDGDYFEAELVEGGILLKPVIVVDKAQIWQKLERALGTGELPGKTDPSEEEIMEFAVAAVKEARRAKHEGAI